MIITREKKTGKKHSVRTLGTTTLCLLLAVGISVGGPDGRAASYTFQKNQTAVTQLNNLFTTVDLMDATIAELQAEMKKGNVTSARLTQMYIDRIKAYDESKKLNSIISINPNAVKEAKALDKKRKKGKNMGKLYGIPVIIKDNYDVKGMATTAGSVGLIRNIADKDSFAVKKLRAAGAVILAKANLSEFAMSAVDSGSTLGGMVHNAYNTEKASAGSSGGTAVAVTANFAAAGLGTDTGGSIRNPSSFSNLYGIRPSKGLTSIDGIIPLNAERDTAGPIARTAEDMALMLETIAGTDPEDTYTVEADADRLLGKGYSSTLSKNGLKNKRIGYLKSSWEFEYPTNPEDEYEVDLNQYPDEKIEQMVSKARANLAKAGAELVDLSEILTDEQIEEMSDGAYAGTFEYELNRYFYNHKNAPVKTLKELLLTQKQESVSVNYEGGFFSNYIRDELADSFESMVNPNSENVGGFMRTDSWQKTLDYRKRVSDIMKANKIDAIMYLGFFNAPHGKDEPTSMNQSYYLYTFGPSMGFPEMSIPMGFGEKSETYTSEMPVGLNIFADFGQEKTLMDIAYAYEKQAGSFIRRMPETVPALADENLNAYLETLMDKVYSINYSAYKKKPTGKVKLMYNAYERAAAVDTSDPDATYKAAAKLARAYDRVIKALKKSGLKKKNKTNGRQK